LSLSVFTLISCIAPISLSNRAIAQTATPSTQSATEEKDLKTKVTEVSTGVISALNDTEIGGDFDASTKKHKIDGVNINPILKKIESRKKKRTFLKSIGRGYKSLKSKYTIKDITIAGNTASVDIKEYTEAEFSDPGEAATGIVPKYIKNHRLVFEVTGKNKLKLTAHKLINSSEEPDPEKIKNIPPTPPDVLPGTIDLPNSVSSTYLRPIELKSARNMGVNSIPRHYPLLLANAGTVGKVYYSMSLSKVYNRDGAVKYAGQFWENYNEKYREFDDVGGDCTNFTSQSLFEGGGVKMRKTDDAKENIRNWWYDFQALAFGSKSWNGQSYTWTSAPHFYNFLAAHPEIAVRIYNTSSLEKGDIVQFDLGHGGISHTMIVSAKRAADGMIYLSGHSDDHYLYPIYDILAKNPGVKIYPWKLNDYY
jgi:hypothetical protein